MPASPLQSKRILYVTGTGYLPRSVSGANISLHARCERLRALGHEPIVVCTAVAAGAGASGWPEPEYKVIRVADPIAAMTEMIPVLAPDATVVRGPWPAIAAVHWASAMPERRLHVEFAGISFDRGFPAPSAAPLVRYAANSRFLVQLCEAMLGRPVAFVPNLIEPAAYRCTPAGEAILFVNPVSAKGAHLVAAIAERLSHRRFLVARPCDASPDDPPVEISLPNVETVATTQDMRALYARTRLVLMPSLVEESWGRVISEAQVSGIPAVAADRGALRENLGAGGIVLSLGAPVERWCEAIEALLGDAAAYAQASQAAKAQSERVERAPDSAVARFLDFIAR